ncbi:MAG: dTDP-4-dehydrorhamnose 3,5-epimerase [Flavobacteriaceae bacterium]|nr:dTDP-4-dehydrorhamnose 3,5-epimerase [Flavobacteriaceae bacterium]|tara:strand:- start:620 stop:1192 length:573 start_codon:yes stop_codon:yes gene_type:complete
MTIIPTLFKEVFLLKTEVHIDVRGSFSEHFSAKVFEKAFGHKINFCQDNITHSKKGVLRGLHYQLPPYGQSKLVSVIQGGVLDVVVDIRKGSPTFGHHFSKELTSENQLQLFIPKGFAHGYITLTDHSIFHYKVDQYYYPENEGSIAPNDQVLGINWRLPETSWIQSKKDQNHPLFKESPLFDFKDNSCV